MVSSNPTGLQNSGTNTQLRQVLLHLQIASPAEGDPTCQVCGEVIPQTEPVTLYLSRPAGQSGYTIDQCRCTDHNDDLTGLFTLGTWELVVVGRIGQCRDRASRQTCPVLLAPTIRLISAADTKSGRRITGHPGRLIHTNYQQCHGTNSRAVLEQSQGIEPSDQHNTLTVQATGGRK
jgi:hypothetical protein